MGHSHLFSFFFLSSCLKLHQQLVSNYQTTHLPSYYCTRYIRLCIIAIKQCYTLQCAILNQYHCYYYFFFYYHHANKSSVFPFCRKHISTSNVMILTPCYGSLQCETMEEDAIISNTFFLMRFPAYFQSGTAFCFFTSSSGASVRRICEIKTLPAVRARFPARLLTQ